MPSIRPSHYITVRVKIGEAEVEATGPRAWVERQIKTFIVHRKKAAAAIGGK